MASAVLPPLQAIAPVLAAGAAIAGAVDAAKTCASGFGLDCAIGLAGMVPGGRLLGKVGKEAKAAKKAMDSADEIEDVAKAGQKGARPSGTCPIPGHSLTRRPRW
jgi:hypothetical protein